MIVVAMLVYLKWNALSFKICPVFEEITMR